MIKAWSLPAAYAPKLQNLIRESGKDRGETVLVCDKCSCHRLASKWFIRSRFKCTEGKKDEKRKEALTEVLDTLSALKPHAKPPSSTEYMGILQTTLHSTPKTAQTPLHLLSIPPRSLGFLPCNHVSVTLQPVCNPSTLPGRAISVTVFSEVTENNWTSFGCTHACVMIARLA